MGGYPGTNLCVGLYEAKKYLVDGPHIQQGASRYLVIITDGDNTYTDGAQSSLRGNIPNSSGSTTPPIYPPPQWPTSGGTSSHSPCRIGGFHQDSTDNGTDYDNRVNALDTATYNLAQALKNAPNNVEIYVIGYGVVGSANSTPSTTSYCSGIGQQPTETTATPGTGTWPNASRPQRRGPTTTTSRRPTASQPAGHLPGIALTVAFRLIK